MRLRPFLSIALVTVLATVATACGSDDGPGDESPRALLAQAASKHVESGEVRMRAAADIPGFPILGDKLEVTGSGPFEMRGSGTPEVDWDVVLRAGGQSFPAQLTATGGKAYVDFQGLTYVADPEMFGGLPSSDGKRPTLKGMGIDPSRWLLNPKVEDGEEIGGDSTRLVTGTVDERAVLEDILAVAEKQPPEIDEESLDQVAEAIEGTKVEVNVDDEGYARRVFASLRFQLPEGIKDAAFEGGSVSFELVLEEIGARVDVVPPSNPRPLSDLLNFAGLIFGVEKPSDLWTIPR